MFSLLTHRKQIGAVILYDVVCHSASAMCSYENGLTSSERVSSKVRWCSCSLSDACGFCDSESSVTTKIFETGLKPLFLPPKFFCQLCLNRQPNLTTICAESLPQEDKELAIAWIFLGSQWGTVPRGTIPPEAVERYHAWTRPNDLNRII